MSKNGRLIAFCGLAGSGKTTQIALVQRELAAQGLDVVVTGQPTDWYRLDETARGYLDSGVGCGTREIDTELALFAAADRLRHVRTVIRPAVERGAIVLSDQYDYASYGCFAAGGRRAELPWLDAVRRPLLEPDAILLLDLPPRVAMARRLRRDRTGRTYRELPAELIEQVRQELLQQAGEMPGTGHVIDGQLEVELIHTEVMTVVDGLVQDMASQSRCPAAAYLEG